MFNAFYKMVGNKEPEHHAQHPQSRQSIRFLDPHQNDQNAGARRSHQFKRTSSGEETGSTKPRRSIRFQNDAANTIHHRRRSRKSLLRKPGSESNESMHSSNDKMRDSVVSDFERQHRRSTFVLSRDDLIERMRYGTTCWYRFKRRVLRIFKYFFRYLGALFSIPWSPEPISLRLEKDKDVDESEGGTAYDDFMKESDLEVMCNYDSVTKNLFEQILRDRRDLLSAKDTYHVMKVDMDGYPLWSQGNVDRLRYTFQVFDVSGDGLVDFDEFSSVLVEFGDNSPEEMRKKHFNLAKAQDSDSIDFLRFLTLVYDLTKDEDSMEDFSLAETFRTIDRNMGRIRGLDVVQQLQAGLF